MTIVNPAHPPYGLTLLLRGVTLHPRHGRLCAVAVGPAAERLVPLLATDLAGVVPPPGRARLSAPAAEALLAVVASLPAWSREEGDASGGDGGEPGRPAGASRRGVAGGPSHTAARAIGRRGAGLALAGNHARTFQSLLGEDLEPRPRTSAVRETPPAAQRTWGDGGATMTTGSGPAGEPAAEPAGAPAAAPPARGLERLARPAASYAAALAQVRALQERDAASALDPVSHTKLFGPAGEIVPGGAAYGGARRTGRVYVCLHGLTNSPQQYVPLAARLLARGDATVFIPRLPRHGLADRMTTALAQLAEAELVDATAAALDTAAGLGDEVVVTGISMGGVLATWAAQYRPVARVVIVAPALGLPCLPPPTIGPLTALALRLPNRYIWWDPRQKEAVAGPTYAYPRFATHALARIQRLGLRLAAVARTAPPAARSVWLVTNAADLAISNRQVDRLAANWERAGATNLRRYVFPRRLKLFHDLVDPLQPNQQVAVSHPALERLVADGAAPILPPEAPAAAAP